MVQIIIFSLFISLLALSPGAQAAPKALQPVAVVVNNAKGEQVASLNLTQEKNGVQMALLVNKLPPGSYAVHIHENGLCDGPDFKSAGDHFNPENKKHGKVTGGSHAGDLPNIEVKEDGTGEIHQRSNRVTLEEGAHSLLRSNGTSLVIHAKADDYKTQPSGGAGDRIACGVIKSPTVK
ncbi:MAG: superoxide dismutase family protein [Bdellovibrio sp.]